MLRVTLLTLLMLLATGAGNAAAPSTGRGTVMRLRDGARIDFSRMIGEIKNSRAVFVGEIHSRSSDHRLQLRVADALHRRKIPLAIGLEMFSADRQPELDAWIAGRLSLDRFRFIYAQEWNIPWRYYRDIFLYARKHRIPLLGLNIPERITVKVGRLGFASLSSAELAKIPHGVTCNVDANYREFIRQAHRQHGLSEKSFQNFCEAQMLWNKAMAWHLAEYLKRRPERLVVVLTGTGHAQKRGAPVQLAEYLAAPAAVVLPEDPQILSSRVTSSDADYLVLRSRLR